MEGGASPLNWGLKSGWVPSSEVALKFLSRVLAVKRKEEERGESGAGAGNIF
jgi:hypothetical protein